MATGPFVNCPSVTRRRSFRREREPRELRSFLRKRRSPRAEHGTATHSFNFKEATEREDSLKRRTGGDVIDRLTAEERPSRRSDDECRETATIDGDVRRTHILVLPCLGGLERPVDPLLHVEGVLGERGDVLKRRF